jgi:hypothetical protein
MTKVIVDQTVLAQIFDLSRMTELCDPSGQVIGLFVPTVGGGVRVAEEGECPYSDEEIRILRQQSSGRPLKEIWRDQRVQW